MKFPLLLVLLALVAGCASNDARLNGTWHSNREATVAAALRHNPSLTNLPPYQLERFGDMYGQLMMTYSNGVATQCFDGKRFVWHYKVVEKGPDFVVIRRPEKGTTDTKIRFVESGKAYWVSRVANYDERFDKVEDK